jgi:hypothetical protein
MLLITNTSSSKFDGISFAILGMFLELAGVESLAQEIGLKMLFENPRKNASA